MGTKTDPGKYDCYESAASDEPMFILLARDPTAPDLVYSWARRCEEAYGSSEKIEEARECAGAMRAWAAAHPDGDKKKTWPKASPPCGVNDDEWLLMNKECIENISKALFINMFSTKDAMHSGPSDIEYAAEWCFTAARIYVGVRKGYRQP